MSNKHLVTRNTLKVKIHKLTKQKASDQIIKNKKIILL